MDASAQRTKLRIALALAFAGLSGACGSLEGLVPGAPDARTSVGAAAHSAPATNADKIVVLPMTAEDLDCPAVEVEDGAATARIGGPENSAVQHQFDLVDTARECQPAGNQFSLKVGVTGRLLIGPAGSPGTYSTNVKVLVRREVDQKTAFEKSYRVEANTGSAYEAPFRLVTELIMLPMYRPQLNDDYSIFVGFDNGRNVALERPRHRRKPQQAKAAAPAAQ
jgi:hypothetical protein